MTGQTPLKAEEPQKWRSEKLPCLLACLPHGFPRAPDPELASELETIGRAERI